MFNGLHKDELFSGATYLGCYNDDGNRALSNDISNFSSGDVIGDCLRAAINGGFNIFGVQNSNQCFAGTLDPYNPGYNRYGASSKCTMQCVDGSGRICGGDWSNSVFQVNPPANV